MGKVKLPIAIFGAKINPELMAQAVRIYLANQRRGTANTKDRGDVSGGGRKPWRQKGTGRARQGSIRSPLWVGGGVAHGPHPKDWSLKFNKKMKRKALFSALSQRYLQQKIKVIEKLNFSEPKTKKAKELIDKIGLPKRILIVLPQVDKGSYLSFRNLPDCASVMAAQLNTYLVLKYDELLIVKESLPVLEKTFLGAINSRKAIAEKEIKDVRSH